MPLKPKAVHNGRSQKCCVHKKETAVCANSEIPHKMHTTNQPDRTVPRQASRKRFQANQAMKQKVTLL